jgi:hypothetical protein
MPARIACLKNSVSMRKLLTRKKQEIKEKYQITEWFETPEHVFRVTGMCRSFPF